MVRSVRTPLALAILSFLHERPMHPYEMKQLMAQRGLSSAVRVSGGALYSTIERLMAGSLVEATGTSREGNRPERTTYALTDEGRTEFMTWLQHLIVDPVHEYPWFGSAITFIAHLSPDELTGLLREREQRLIGLIVQHTETWEQDDVRHVPRLFRVEDEYALAMRQAELDWVRRTIQEVEAGEITWPVEVLDMQAANRLMNGAPSSASAVDD